MPGWLMQGEAMLLGQGDAAAQQPGLSQLLLPFLVIGILFYFLMIRPEKRKRANVSKMQEGLKKNDKVVTIGGLIGVVVSTSKDDPEVTLRIDENNNTRIHIIRSAISRVITDDKSVAEGDSE